eukprot:TRINITY_DN3099_c0_g1_i1.p1 TRINITY_DN3099_c0_g1~~TRINITY_DN3099_c0_g1_i1.p1  ORF type:complete len:551 (+),score=160.14 TRINITY_DN3099_c0_g1_i1:214-1866(+)
MEGVSSSSSLCLPRFSWSQTCLYHGASETDLLSIAGAASFQLFKLCSEVEGYICSSLSRQRALFLLLGSGGLSLWILYRKSEGKEEIQGDGSSSQGAKKVSWLRWLFSEGEKDFFLLSKEEEASLLRRKSIAPCPNCQRGICRIRRHQAFAFNSPIHYRRGGDPASRFLPPTSTPDSADDENSDHEDIIYLQFGHSQSHRKRQDSWLNSGSFISSSNRSEGEGMSDPSSLLNSNSQIYYPTAKLYSASKRSPGDGQDHYCGGGPSSLSSGGEPCDCGECLSLASSRYEREESVDSIISATGSMVELIKGAREVRKLIREASFDSLASDLSFNNNNNSVAGSHSSSVEPVKDEDGAVPPCLRINQSLNKNFYSMIALSSLDFEPTSSSASGVNSLEWESPSHGWHDVRESKYKLSLPPESDQELEWDAEMPPLRDEGRDITTCCFGALELDMETELLRSASSSRRSSISRMGKRLPPSGRSSADRELSEPPLVCNESQLSPVHEAKEPRENNNHLKYQVPSLIISLSRDAPPDNIEIMNNNNNNVCSIKSN